MRKSWMWLFALLLAMTVTVTGCGTQSQDSVLKSLQAAKQDVKSYQSKAIMEVRTPTASQKYYIETWYQQPDLYRIALGNENKEITQVIVHNQDGIFVVNPQLKKSFKFRGEWAEHQGHIYLYHAMIDRIMNAPDKTFDKKDGFLSFKMPMMPENPIVTQQEIVFDSKNLHPSKVVLYDKSNKAVVTVTYQEFKTGVTFEKNTFTPESAMAMAKKDSVAVVAGDKSFGVVEPSYLPKGMKMQGQPYEQNGTVYLRYSDGKQSLTIVEKRPDPTMTPMPMGSQIEDLYGVPAITSSSGDVTTMTWVHNGIEFNVTGTVSVSDMNQIAQSTLGSVGK